MNAIHLEPKAGTTISIHKVGTVNRVHLAANADAHPCYIGIAHAFIGSDWRELRRHLGIHDRSVPLKNRSINGTTMQH